MSIRNDSRKEQMMDTRLSTVLLNGGFFPVLGTTERMGPSGSNPVVLIGTQFSWDANNGIMVVYDERGWPWITLWWNGARVIDGLERDFNLRRGAFVPHSNDGGCFVYTVAFPGGEK